MTPFQTMILSGLISAAALPASAEVPRVVTDLPITASLVQQVMGDLGQPDLLLDKGADPHHFQLRPDQARALSRADLLIWVGPEMTPWLDRGAESLASDTSALLLLAVPQTHRIAFAEAEIIEDPDAIVELMRLVSADRELAGSIDSGMSEQVRASIAKRAVLRFTPFRYVSWDHGKLDGVY